jgi:hypothetical protein
MSEFSHHSTVTLTKSLADDSRANLESWLEELETHAQNLCPNFSDVTEALTLVVPDLLWNQIPENLANPAGVAAGKPPQYCACPTSHMPTSHSDSTAAGVVSLHRAEAVRHTDYSKASSTLKTALLASIGEANTYHLKTTFPALKTYMLSPRDIVDIMRAKHGITTSDDVSKLRAPLSRALMSVYDLTGHMDSFLLASQRLTRSGQG